MSLTNVWLQTPRRGTARCPSTPGPAAGGGGVVTYPILDDQRRMDVLNVVWMGRLETASE